jgi:hypothetical protein
MIMMPNSPRRRNSRLLLVAFLTIIFFLLIFQRVHRLVSSHTFDLAYADIFRTQFQVYILTHSCGRLTPTIAAAFDSVLLVPDVRDSRDCASLAPRHKQLRVETERAGPGAAAPRSKDDAFRDKYVRVLQHCQREQKMKCLILEDDVVFLHSRERTREVLVENTLTLFNWESDAYDCTKRGFGWLPSTHTGNGSQCRVFSKPSAECMVKCLRDGEHEQLDFGLATCQAKCRLTQKRFLLAVHSGLSSTMGRLSKSS